MPPESAFNMVSEAVPTPMRPSHATPLDCTAPILAAALSRSCIGSAGLLGRRGRKNEGGYHLPFTIYRLPLITIDLTAHPRCFLTVTASGVFAPPCIGFVTYSITSAPSIALLFAVPSLTTGSAILRALLCQRHSPALPLTPRLSTWCTAIGCIVDTATRSTSASGPANIANVLRRRRQYWPSFSRTGIVIVSALHA